MSDDLIKRLDSRYEHTRDPVYKEAADALEAAERVMAQAILVLDPIADEARKYPAGADWFYAATQTRFRIGDLTPAVDASAGLHDWLARHATQRQGGSMAEVVMARSPRAQALLEEIDLRKRKGGIKR